MPLTTFDTFQNNAHAFLAGGGYAAGSGSLILSTGLGSQFGSSFPIRVTVITQASYGTASEVLTIYSVTGRSTDTLTGVTAVEGTTDRNYGAGDIVEMRWTAGEANLNSTVTNALQAPASWVTDVPSSGVWTANLGTSDWHEATITQNTTVSITGGFSGQRFFLRATQGSGNWTLAFMSGVTITWFTPGAVAPSLPATSGQILEVAFVNTGTNTYDGYAVGTSPASALIVSAGGTGLSSIGTASQILGVNTAATALEYKTITAGSNVTVTPGAGSITISSTASGSGSVTSVALALPSSILTVSGSPVTSTGTLTGSLATQAPNLVFVGPSSGGSAAPTFRALVDADIPNTGLTLTSYSTPPQNDGSVSGTYTPVFSTGVFRLATLSNTTTLSLANLAAGQTARLRFTQGSGSYVLNWPSSGITWFTTNYTAPSIPTSSGGVINVLFTCISSGVYDGFYSGSSAN